MVYIAFCYFIVRVKKKNYMYEYLRICVLKKKTAVKMAQQKFFEKLQ